MRSKDYTEGFRAGAASAVNAMLPHVNDKIAAANSLKMIGEAPESEVLHSKIAGPMAVAAKRFGVSVEDILGHGRSTEKVSARLACFVYARNNLGWKLEAIGRAFNRDHSTVIHGLQNVENIAQTDVKRYVDIMSTVDKMVKKKREELFND